MTITVSRLTKSYGSNTVLRGVDLEIRAGQVHALLGPNGAGKSTLLGCLSGATQPDEGTITIDGTDHAGFTPATALKAGTATIYQHFQLIGDLSISDNIYLGSELRTRSRRIDQRAQRQHTAQLIASLGLAVDPATRVDTLSVGQQQVVEIARALHREPSLLILDEPTAALSTEEVATLLDLVRTLAHDRGLAVIYVTHLLQEVMEVSDVVTVIRDGDVFWTRDTSALVLGDVIEAISPQTGIERAVRDRVHGEAVLIASALHASYTGPIDLEVRGGEIVGVFGLLGSGRTDLLETLAGVRRPLEGSISVAGRAVAPRSPGQMHRRGVSLVPADRKAQALFGELSSLENMLMPHFSGLARGARRRATERAVFRDTASHVGLLPADPDYEVGQLSGGNAQKVSVGRWLTGLDDLSVLLLDEPTQGVDVGAREDLYELLRDFVASGERSIVFASSDPEETIALADRVLVLHEGRSLGVLQQPIDEGDLVALAHAALVGTPSASGTL
jgi:ribose transport system ATP-binding protein